MSLADSLKSRHAFCSKPDLLGKLLDIIWMVICKGNNLFACILVNVFPSFLKSPADKIHPLRRLYLIEKQHVAELIERHGIVGEYFKHHMAFTPVKTI